MGQKDRTPPRTSLRVFEEEVGHVGSNKIEKSLTNRKIQHPSKFWEERTFSRKNTKTKMTAFATSIDFKGGCLIYLDKLASRSKSPSARARFRWSIKSDMSNEIHGRRAVNLRVGSVAEDAWNNAALRELFKEHGSWLPSQAFASHCCM